MALSRWGDDNGELAFIAGWSWNSLDQRDSLAFTFHTGDEGPQGDTRTLFDLVYARRMTSRLVYTMQTYLGIQQNAQIVNGATPGAAEWFGLNQYLFYTFSDRVSFGTRFEWFRDQENFRVLSDRKLNYGNRGGTLNGGDYFNLTFGMNYRFYPGFNFRPELRWDWSNADGSAIGGPYDDLTEEDQFTLAMDLIMTF